MKIFREKIINKVFKFLAGEREGAPLFKEAPPRKTLSRKK